MKRNKRITGFLAVILTAMLLWTFQALAAGSIDKDAAVTLTLSHQNGKTPISGAPFSVYLVAEVDENGELTLTKEFKQFHVKIYGTNIEAWKNLATTLEGYVLRDKIPATDSGTTDSRGMLRFPTKGTGENGQTKFSQGLYLVLGNRYTLGNRIYTPSPFMVLLPSQDKIENVWDYDVTVTTKYDSQKVPGGDTEDIDDDITRRVLKVWKDTGHESERPQEITIDLLENGEVYDTVTLKADNNWRYTWDNLDKDSRWTVVEKTVDDYYVQVSREGTTFVVTNTYTETITDGPPPHGDTPDDMGGLGAVDYIDDPMIPTGILPQTGQYWWLAHTLFAAGLFCLAAGIFKRIEM